MSRRKKNDGDTATIKDAPEAMDEQEEQGVLFPELNMDSPEDKALFAAARRYNRTLNERMKLLKPAKEKEDAAKEALVGLMLAYKERTRASGFTHKGLMVEISPGAAKVSVTAVGEQTDDGE